MEKISSMKCLELDDCFEVAFENQLAVPYSRIDNVEALYPQYGGSAVYMVLRRDRLELTGVSLESDPPVIKYRNCADGREGRLENLWFFSHPVPKAALHMELTSPVTLEVGIKEQWRRREPSLAEYTPVELSVYDLVSRAFAGSRRFRKTSFCISAPPEMCSGG